MHENGQAGARFADTAYLGRQLAKAQCLLGYAAESGIAIDDATRAAVLDGDRAQRDGWTPVRADAMVKALTTLAARVRPVTVDSLAVCSGDSTTAKRQIGLYTKVIWILGALLVPFSLANFCVSKLAETIQNDLHNAQDLAVKLNNELYDSRSAPDGVTRREPIKSFPTGVTQASVIVDLTQFAIAIRAINTHATKLNFFICDWELTPFQNLRSGTREARNLLELEPGLQDLVREEQGRVAVYQRIRDFAQSVQVDASIVYGALLNCLLPMLYAILGTLAFLLRTFEQQVQQRTFTAVDGHAARFAIAAIGGFVVGLFNLNIAPGTTTPGQQTATVSPLAIAFLVGYAVDVFFSFLEGLIRTFARDRGERPSSEQRAT